MRKCIKFIKARNGYGFHNRLSGIYKTNDVYELQLRNLGDVFHAITIYKSKRKPTIRHLGVLAVAGLLFNLSIVFLFIAFLPFILVSLILHSGSFILKALAYLVRFEIQDFKQMFRK